MQGSPMTTLIVSVLVLALCCMPLGVVSVVFSALAMSAESSGDFVTAERHLGTAHTVNTVAIVLGIVLILVYVCLLGASV